MKEMSLWKFPSDAILSVKSFTASLKEILEQQIPPCWIRGEISNLKQQSSGHFYFTLKDSESQINAVIFRGDAARQSTQPVEGKELLVYGQLQVYEPRGTYQLIVRCVLPVGDGRLRLEFERNKALLQAEGIFDADRKKSLPFYPKKIALITSPTGAVLHDFNQILLRGDWKGTVVLLPAAIQGINAMGEILEQLKVAASLEGCDAVVIARGGGSLEDLWVFNDPILVRAIAACPKPTLTAIGHETDTTLADYAADRRFETPSAAAHWVLNASMIVLQRKEDLEMRLKRGLKGHLEVKRNTWLNFTRYWDLLSPRNYLAKNALRLGELEGRLEQILHRNLRIKQESFARAQKRLPFSIGEMRVQRAKLQLKDLDRQLEYLVERKIKSLKERLIIDKNQLKNNELQHVLRKGFAYVKSKEGNFIGNSKDLRHTKYAELYFSDGKRDIEVLE